MDGLKESKQAVGAATLTAVNNLSPPTVLAQASRLNFSTRLFNLLVTNIPGPQIPLYVLGRKLTDLLPVAFLPENHALAIAIMSYDGGIDFGLLGDYDALPDIDLIAEGIDAALAELLEAARGEPPARPQRRTSHTAARRRAASTPQPPAPTARTGADPPDRPRTAPSAGPPPTCAPSGRAGAARPQAPAAAEAAATSTRPDQPGEIAYGSS